MVVVVLMAPVALTVLAVVSSRLFQMLLMVMAFVHNG
jgi:hypothetical protein